MKRIIIAAAVIISLCTIVNLAIITAKSDDVPLDTEHCYIIKDHDGMVACFEQESDTPFIITEVYTVNLPPLDRKQLKDGIEVHSARELSRALEDYRT